MSNYYQVQLLLRKVGNDNSGLTHLAKARIEKGLSIADITRLTGLSYDNYIKYEKEEVKAQYMSLDTLRKLSEVLDIDLMTDYHKFKENAVQLVCEHMERNKLSIRKFAAECGVSATTIKNCCTHGHDLL